MAALGRRLGTSLFLRGTVFRWRREASGGGAASAPAVELSLMLIDASGGRILWASHHERRGDQYQRLLGLGSVTNVVALADRVVAEMVASLRSVKPERASGSRPPPGN
jgi:hypothetical protein